MITDKHCKLWCELKCFSEHRKEMNSKRNALENTIRRGWKSLGVIATIKSSVHLYKPCNDDNNNLGYRFGDAYYPIDNILLHLRGYKLYLDQHKQKYEKYSKWYQLIKRFTISLKIEEYEEDIRLFSLLIERYNNDESLIDNTRKKKELGIEIDILDAIIQDIKYKIECNCKQCLESYKEQVNAINR